MLEIKQVKFKVKQWNRNKERNITMNLWNYVKLHPMKVGKENQFSSYLFRKLADQLLFRYPTYP